MKRVFYAGTQFMTTDSVADELIKLAEELANHQRAGTVVVPGYREDGQVDEFTIVIGPSSQIVFNNDVTVQPLEAEDVASSLRDTRLRLVHPPQAQVDLVADDVRSVDDF